MKKMNHRKEVVQPQKEENPQIVVEEQNDDNLLESINAENIREGIVWHEILERKW